MTFREIAKEMIGKGISRKKIKAELMTMRQLVIEVMREHGFTDEEIMARSFFASSLVPGMPVDRELPPTTVPALREHLRAVYDACQADPKGHAEWAEQMAKLISNN